MGTLWPTVGIVAVSLAVIAVCIYVAVQLSEARNTRTRVRKLSSDARRDRRIPKLVWSYWNEANAPPFVKACWASWKRHNPDFFFVHLNAHNVSAYLPEGMDLFTHPLNDSPQHESDLVRAYVMAEFGGVWSDATIIVHARYDFAEALGAYDFIGYYIDEMTALPRFPVVENWFFATRPGGTFMTAWRNAFTSLSVETVLTSIDVQNIPRDLQRYLFQHLCAQYVMQKMLGADFVGRHMWLRKAEDGPFRYLVDASWDSERAVKELVHTKSSKSYIHKLRGFERAAAMRLSGWKELF